VACCLLHVRVRCWGTVVTQNIAVDVSIISSYLSCRIIGLRIVYFGCMVDIYYVRLCCRGFGDCGGLKGFGWVANPEGMGTAVVIWHSIGESVAVCSNYVINWARVRFVFSTFLYICSLHVIPSHAFDFCALIMRFEFSGNCIMLVWFCGILIFLVPKH